MRFLTLCLLFGYGLSLTAQSNLRIEESLYTVGNGLTGFYTNFTHLDSRGLIWMGTQSGLHRYDGTNFKTYDTNNGFPFEEIMEIYEDEAGFFWLFRSCFSKGEEYCYPDVFFFHPLTEEVLTFKERFGETTPLDGRDIRFVLNSRNGHWFFIRTEDQSFIWTAEEGFQIFPRKVQLDTRIIDVLNDGSLAMLTFEQEEPIYRRFSSQGQMLNESKFENDLNPANYLTFPSHGFNAIRALELRKGRKNSHFFTIDKKGALQDLVQLEQIQKYTSEIKARHRLYLPGHNLIWEASPLGVRKYNIPKYPFLQIETDFFPGRPGAIEGLDFLDENTILSFVQNSGIYYLNVEKYPEIILEEQGSHNRYLCQSIV